MNQTYVTHVKMSDDVAPEVASLGLIVPVLGYFALKRIFIDPYIARQAAALRRGNKKRNRQEVEKQRKEAEQAVMLMKETVERKLKLEQSVGGLIILEAHYGKLLLTSDDDILDDMPSVVDVTMAVQCMVEKSVLTIHEVSGRLIGQ